MINAEILREQEKNLLWGTYGKPVTFPVRWVRLIDCTTEHLKNILKTQFQLDELYRLVIKNIITDRRKDESNM